MKRWIIRKDGVRQRYEVKHPKRWARNKVYDKNERGWAIAVQEVHVVFSMIGSDGEGNMRGEIGEVEMDFAVDMEHIDDNDYIYGEAEALCQKEIDVAGIGYLFSDSNYHERRGIHKGKKYKKGKEPEARVVPRYGN